MPKFVIEREMQGVGKLNSEQLREAAKGSNIVIRELGPSIQWITSYITDNKLYCVYIAPNEDILFEHAQCANIPADRISKVVVNADPTTGE